MAKAARTTQKETTATDTADGRKEYEVTKNAPPRVAGRRAKAGDKLMLTEAEARGELLARHIQPTAPLAASGNA